jgi:hypothetical protein
MESVSSGIAHGPDKRLLVIPPHIREEIGLEDDFIKDRYGMNRMTLRADTTVVSARLRVGHVRFVVLRVEVLSIPARGEEYLGAETVCTVVVREAVCFGPGWAVII